MAARRTRTAEPVVEKPVVEEPVVEETVVEETKPKRKSEPRECGCGCGGMTRGGGFVIGHDMKLKSRLLAAFDAGDESAGAELVERGWRTEADLTARKVEGPAARSAASAEDRKAAKVAKLDAKIAALTTERATLVGEVAS